MLLSLWKFAWMLSLLGWKSGRVQTHCPSHVTKDKVTTLLNFPPKVLAAMGTLDMVSFLYVFESASHGSPTSLFSISRHKPESSLLLRPFHFSQRALEPPSGPSAELAKKRGYLKEPSSSVTISPTTWENHVLSGLFLTRKRLRVSPFQGNLLTVEPVLASQVS